MKNVIPFKIESKGSTPSTLAHILIVEDDIASATVLKTALTNKNFQVSCVHDGQSALDTIQQNRPDLILLDACLPNMDGFQLCEKIRQIEHTNDVPVYMITSLIDRLSIEKGFSHGATDYIPKPYNIQVLCNRLTSMFESKSKFNSSIKASSIIGAMRLWSDYVVELDGKSRFVVGSEQLPNSLTKILDKNIDIDKLMRMSIKRESANSGNANHAPAFWIQTNNSQETKYYRFQVFYHFSGQQFVTIIDDTSNMDEAASLYLDEETQLPNQAKLKQYLQYDADKSLPDNYNVATVHISNYSKIRSIMGKDLILRHIHNLIDNVFTIAKKLDTSLEVFRTQKDTFVIIDNTLNKREFYHYMCDVAQPVIYDVESYEIENVFIYSIGIATNHLAQDTPQLLLKKSGMAAQTSELTTNRVRYFAPAMQDSFDKTENILGLMRRDIEELKMELHFQPKFNTQTLELTGLEALLRWHCDELGAVSPGEFLPIAESANMMRPISKLVIEKALYQISQWIDLHSLNVPVSINLDATNLSDSSLIDWFIQSVQSFSIPYRLIEVEVTESVMVSAESDALMNIKKLRNVGIRIAMDDFGTGYSSFSYLHSLPLDVLKIDMSFIREIEDDAKIAAIAKAIISIGHEFGLHVVAEGVESTGQLKKLANMGCDAVQGYLTGKPSSAADCNSFFNSPAMVS